MVAVTVHQGAAPSLPALRPYQLAAVDSAIRDLHEVRAVLIEAATGTGKTTTSAELARRAVAAGGRVLFTAHRRELLDQAAARLRLFGLSVTRDVRGWAHHEVTVVSIQTLARRIMWLPRNAFVLVIADECFPAGTLVDGRPIETIKPGDMVRSYNHGTGRVELRPVRHVRKSRPDHLLEISLDDGRQIVCTLGHPLWLGPDHGYVPAWLLQTGDTVYGGEEYPTENLRCVRHRVPAAILELDHGSDVLREVQERASRCQANHAGHELCRVPETGFAGGKEAFGSSAEWSCLLFDGVQGHVGLARQFAEDESDQPTLRLGQDAREQPDEEPGVYREDAIYVAGDRTSACVARGERDRSVRTGVHALGSASWGVAVEPRVRDGHAEVLRVPDPLQDRSGETGHTPRSRGRWWKPHGKVEAVTGPEERGVSPVARVARIEVHERGSAERFGALCPDDFVYNIEVGDNHNYFVEGVLVHNCHHAPARSYRTVLDHFETARVVGVTATPDRADGVSLGTVFDRCSYRYGIVEAVEAGYLVPARGVQVEVPGMDLSSVRAKAVGEGDTPRWIVDLHQGDLGRVVVDPKAVEGITGPLVELTTKDGGAARDMRTIVFAVNRRHARALAASLNARKPGSARSVDGSMKTKEREEVLQAHRDGAFQYLVNVALLCEGYDDPSIECVAMAAPTQSRIKYAQCAGRGLRPAPGKSECFVIDFIGVSCVHDLVGPEDVLGGALVAVQRYGAPSSPSRLQPVDELEYVPWAVPVQVRFSVKVVKLIRRGVRAAGRGIKKVAAALVC